MLEVDPCSRNIYNTQTGGNDKMQEADPPIHYIDPPIHNIDPPIHNIDPPIHNIDPPIHNIDPPIHNINPLIHSIYHCDFCGKAFSQRKRLNRHLKIHTGPRDYICKFCNKTFYRKDHLKGHIVRTHVDMLKSWASDVQE